MSEAEANRSKVLDLVHDCIGRGVLSGYGIGKGARTDGAPGDELVVTIRVRCEPGRQAFDQGCAA